MNSKSIILRTWAIAFVLCAFLLGSATSLQAQKAKTNTPLVSVKGIIFDQATGEPLAGIQVRAYNNRKYTAMSAADGKFTIKVPTYATSLYVHSDQYLSQQVPVDTTQEMRIRMLADKFGVMYSEEADVTAAATLTTNITSSVTIETDLANQLGAEMRSTQRSGTPTIGNTLFIRGINSLNSNAQPLIIIDGVEQDMQYDRTSLHQGEYTNMLANISPRDIDKVTVLKNATAIYGARGGNGVILIDTKRGHSIATRIDADASVGWSLIPRLPSVMDAYEYRTYASEMLGTVEGIEKYNNAFKFLNDDPNGFYYHTYHNDTDWAKEVYQNAMTQNYSINVQGGDDVGMYNLSVGYVDAESVAKNNDFNRINVRFNTDIHITNSLSTRFDIDISRVSSNVLDEGAPADFGAGTITSPTFLSLIKSPLVNPHQYNKIINGYSELLSGADDLYEAMGSKYSLANPVAILENGSGYNKNIAENTKFHALLQPTWVINKDFSFTGLFNYTLDRKAQRYSRPYEGVPSFEIKDLGTVTSMVASLFSKEINVVGKGQINYKHQFDAHSIQAFAGFKYNYFTFDENDLETQYTGATNDRNPALSSSSGYQFVGGENDVWKVLKWYAQADYNYRNLYFLNFSLAAEANSRFGADCDALSLFGVKWALFPSLQAGWVLSNESFFPKHGVVNYLNLTAGYDISGNDNISNYAARTSLSAVKFNFRATGLQLTNVGNNKIQWESTSKANIGLEGYLFNNRVGFNIDAYLHNTSNLLTHKSFKNPIGGINYYWCNGGELRNSGYEVTLTGKPVVTKNWSVELGASVGHYKNEVTRLPDGDYTTSAYGTDNILTSVGNPVALFYGYETAGVFATDAEAKAAGTNGYLSIEDAAGNLTPFTAGDVHFIDQTGDNIIDEKDKVVIGDPNPDFYGNLFAKATWKNLTLSLGFNYSVGNDIYNYQRSVLNAGDNFYNQQVAMTNHWRYEGQITDMPKLAYGDPMGNSRFSDRWIEDGSYLRLRTVNLSYHLPVSNRWLQGLTIWAEATNLITLTHYLGSDPEFSISNSVFYQGIDCGNIAQGRTFTTGIRINL